jgi:hypothetical protein
MSFYIKLRDFGQKLHAELQKGLNLKKNRLTNPGEQYVCRQKVAV